MILQVKDVTKIYGQDENAVKALNGISLEIEQGEFAALVGTSGSGKSTLLNLIGGLDVPTEGKITIRDREIQSLKRGELTIFRRRNIGFVFQNYSLMPVLNVYDNITLPVTFDKGKHVDHQYIKELLKDLGLWEKRKKYPDELSGGQQQRVAIARAIAAKPPVILADEPTGNLDSASSREILSILKDMHKNGRTVILITHDNGIADQARRVVRIMDGKIESDILNENFKE